MPAFQKTLSTNPAMQGLRDNCVYDGVYRSEGSEPSVVTLNIRTTTSGFTIDRASVRHVGLLDEYQQRCIVEWLTGAVLDVPDIEPGRRYRVTYPMKLGPTKPRGGG